MDVMRGMTLFLMLFVNDLFVPGVPSFLVHTAASTDGMGLADWVFPGFLFMVGMSVPYAMQARVKKGDSGFALYGHVLFRTISLLIISVLILNGSKLDAEQVGMASLTWLILLYVSIFFVWNNYPKCHKNNWLFFILRIIGLIGICYLIVIFKSNTGGWLEISWWGILGLIGWGYFASAMIYNIVKGKMVFIALACLGFLLLNILSQLGLTSNIINRIPFLSVLLSANVPLIVLSGTLTAVYISKEKNSNVLLRNLFFLAIIWLIAGFFLRNWFILSKIYGTPSWALVCNGISLLFFLLLYYLVDIMKFTRGLKLFEEAGKNSLTTYLAPDIIYYILWSLPFTVLAYKQPDNMLIALLGSLIWAFVMLLMAIGLKKLNIHLKL